jgi:hypothetical protein
VNIRFTSTLTTDDENTIAPVVLRALASILDLCPIAYSIQIDTSDSRVYQHSRPTQLPAHTRAVKAHLDDPALPPKT